MHDLYISNGIASFARVGARAWHGLGQQLDPSDGMEAWRAAAGMNFSVETSRAMYYATGPDGRERLVEAPGRRILYRSDTGEALGHVSDRYRVVQPAEVLEFFHDVCTQAGITMETAGVLAGGAKYWALARVADDYRVAGEAHIPYALLATACDGSLATQAERTSVRVVCSNTLRLAHDSEGGAKHKTRHSTAWDPRKAAKAIHLETVDADIRAEQQLGDRLASIKMNSYDAAVLFANLIGDKDAIARAAYLAAEQAAEQGSDDLDALLARPARLGRHHTTIVDAGSRGLASLFDTYNNAPGQRTEAAQGTAWGALQAVTRHVDHERQARSDDTRRQSAWFGPGANLKRQALAAVIDYADHGPASLIAHA